MLLSHLTISPHASTAVAVCLISTLVVVVWNKAYRRPLPGIPFNRDAAKLLMGDLAELGEREKRPEGMKPWFLEQAYRHNSAITQLFLGPFAKPAVLVSDFREVKDILNHRDGVDFKRGKKVDVFRGVLPHAFPSMETYDPRFKHARELVKDLMAPTFLNSVNAPRVHSVGSDLIGLWRVKAKLAQGHPVDIFDDIVKFAFDAILSAAMGLRAEGGDIKHELEHLSVSKAPSSISSDIDDLVQLQMLPKSTELLALELTEQALAKGFYMPSPWLYHRINNLRPSIIHAKKVLKSYIDSQIVVAIERLDRNEEPRSALDYVIHREIKSARRMDRDPVLNDPHILDVIQGYLTAGHDTSTSSLIWIMRRLMANPEQQVKIRQDFRETYVEAYSEQRLPTAEEIVKKRAVCLDAFIEEVLRYHCPILTILVMTKTDTVVLGHHVPADTQVFLNLTGPSLTNLSIPVQEGVRSETAQKYKSTPENWDDFDPTVFQPERWLKKDQDGNTIFSTASGPSLAFSAGNRGCWGKRLGYLEIKIALTMLLWTFKFDIPDKLVSWDTVDTLATTPKQCMSRISEEPIYA